MTKSFGELKATLRETEGWFEGGAAWHGHTVQPNGYASWKRVMSWLTPEFPTEVEQEGVLRRAANPYGQGHRPTAPRWVRAFDHADC